LSLIDAKSGVNRLSDQPQITTNMKARTRGSSSQIFPKRQYALKLQDSNGDKNNQDLLGMGSGGDWVLNISYLDKSLLRNYLAYTIAGQVMEHAPKARYCEVFIKNGDVYQYQGLYLLIQQIEEGDAMVPLAKYSRKYAETAYLLRRDRYREDATVLNTYGTVNNLTKEYLCIEYPAAKDITDATVDYITNDINKFETALFAENEQDFLKYRDYINIKSFVDYFIFNEFFANYDSKDHSVYMYKDLKGKLTMGPVWDFDRSIDNDYPRVLKIDTTAMHDGVWFQQMLRDGDFVKQVINRYSQLRQGVLADARLDALIDETVRQITPAQQRDWNRWNYNQVYDAQFAGQAAHVDLLPLTANRLDYMGTVENLKLTLRAHGHWMDEHLDTLYQFTSIPPGQHAERYRWVIGLLAVILVIGFFTTVYLVQHERSGA